jgi:hypothetical protein
MSAYGVETLENRVLMSAAFSFAAPSVYTSGAPAHSLALGDFTGDGLSDIAVPNPTNNSVTILINQGNGTFARGTPIKLQDPIAVAAGDFTGNGKIDLAVLTDVIPAHTVNLAGASTTNDALVIFDGNGDGTFVRAASYKVIQGGRKIVVGDFNHDGFADLALSTPHAVGVLLNVNGTFAPELRYHVSIGSISNMTTGDFNNDGNTDIVVALPAQMGFRVLLGNGEGTFAIERTVSLGTPPVWLAVGDFTGNGDEDVAAVDADFRNGIFVRLGNGDGTFTKAPVVVHAGAFLQSITSADYNGDGVDDLAVVDFTSTLRVLPGSGDATFEPSIALQGAGPTAFAIYSAVLTPSGKEDLILLRNGNVYVYLNTTA